MSAYGVNKACYLLQVDLVWRERVRADPRAALAEMPLTPVEREALLTGDVATLSRLGADDILLVRIPRFGVLDLTREEYGQRMRSLLQNVERP